MATDLVFLPICLSPHTASPGPNSQRRSPSLVQDPSGLSSIVSQEHEKNLRENHVLDPTQGFLELHNF